MRSIRILAFIEGGALITGYEISSEEMAMANQWAVFVSKAKPALGEKFTSSDIAISQLGKRMEPHDRNTFTTRKAARERAKECCASNRYWHFIVKKLPIKRELVRIDLDGEMAWGEVVSAKKKTFRALNECFDRVVVMYPPSHKDHKRNGKLKRLAWGDVFKAEWSDMDDGRKEIVKPTCIIGSDLTPSEN